MIIKKHKLLIAMTFPLVISIPITSHADTAESRATKIISLTEESEKDNKESSIKEQSDLFIEDLRKKYPHFSDDQLRSMQRAYEDTVLENVTAPKIATQKEKIQADLKLIEKPKEKPLSRKIGQFVNKRTATKPKADNAEAETQNEIKKEAKNTVISLTVKKGDTLSDIARREYGDPNMYIAIYEENKDKLRSPRVVPAGIILRVPKIDSSMKEKFAKMKRDYEKSAAKEKQRKREQRRKLKEQQQAQKRKEEKQREKEKERRAKEREAERAVKREEEKSRETSRTSEKEKTTTRNTRERTTETEDEKTYKSMEELQRLILEGKY